MDRQIIYPGSIPQDTDLLKTNQNAMVALGFLAQVTLGTGTVVDGLACVPTTPASLSVLVGPGAIYSVENLEATSYGSLSADTTDQIVKQGIALGNTSFAITPPATSGQSRVYLIQAEYQDADGGSTVLPYYNAANPAVPYSGPANSGTQQNTVRQGKCILSLKAGTAASTGSQTTPTPDAGYVGLWAVTVANGATTIVSGNIAQYASAPFLKAKLPSLPASIRPQITANTTWYVSPSGNDSNTGTSSSPFLTVQHAINLAYGLDLNGYMITINMADGSYAGATTLNGPFLGGIVQVIGDVATPANCSINTTSANCFTLINGAQLSVGGFEVGTTTNGSAFVVTGNSILNVVQSMNYAQVNGANNGHFLVSDGGIVYENYAPTISGGAAIHYSASRGGRIVLGNWTATLTGTPAFNQFASAYDGGVIYTNNASFSGGATGQRYNVTNCAVIDTGGGGVNFFPGSTAGVGTNPGASPYGMYL